MVPYILFYSPTILLTVCCISICSLMFREMPKSAIFAGFSPNWLPIWRVQWLIWTNTCNFGAFAFFFSKHKNIWLQKWYATCSMQHTLAIIKLFWYYVEGYRLLLDTWSSIREGKKGVFAVSIGSRVASVPLAFLLACVLAFCSRVCSRGCSRGMPIEAVSVLYFSVNFSVNFFKTLPQVLWAQPPPNRNGVTIEVSRHFGNHHQ
jgi:hypothetical protein